MDAKDKPSLADIVIGGKNVEDNIGIYASNLLCNLHSKIWDVRVMLKFLPSGLGSEQFNVVIDTILAMLQEGMSTGSLESIHSYEKEAVFVYNASKEELYDFTGKFAPSYITALASFINAIPEFQNRQWYPLDPAKFIVEDKDGQRESFRQFTQFFHDKINFNYEERPGIRVYQIINLMYPNSEELKQRSVEVSDDVTYLPQFELAKAGRAVLEFGIDLMELTYGHKCPSGFGGLGNQYVCLLMPGWVYDNMMILNKAHGANEENEDKINGIYFGAKLALEITSTHAAIFAIGDFERDLDQINPVFGMKTDGVETD